MSQPVTLVSSGIYTVHAVESGSTLVLATPNTFPPQVNMISLTGVVCPRVARFVANQDMIPDEPLAFEAREYVRRKVIGKSVQFTCDGKVEALNRVVGRINLQDGEDIGLGLATLGLGSVQERQGKGSLEYMEKLIIANENAKKNHLGIYGSDLHLHVRDLRPVEDAKSLLEVLKKDAATHKVLVERVLSGTSLIVTINSLNQQCTLNLWGINVPSQKDASVAQITAESKSHTERCLLHREIHIAFVSTTPNGAFQGSIISGENIFQEDLLRRGYAKTVTASLMGHAHRERFLAAEKHAQERKLGLWKDYVAPAAMVEIRPKDSLYQGDRAFVGTVYQIISGDTLLVVRGETKEKVKVSLASVRPGRTMIRDSEGKDTSVRYENYTWEAKEALRKLCIGKEVRVVIDYARVIEETKEVRAYATVVLAGSEENVGVHLVAHGLAKAMCNGSEVASCADLLKDAESLAMQKKLGIHSGKESAPVRIVELSRITEKKARQYLSYFHRGSQRGRPPRLSATVEMVLGASSIRVYIPKENVLITLKIAGIHAPQGAVGDNAADPLSDDAKHFCMSLIQNRDVEVEVETVDKFGNFLGALYFSPESQNLATVLLAQGLAAVGNVDQLPYAAQLRGAEKQAQEKALGIWKDPKLLPARVQRAKERSERAAPGTLVVARESQFTPVMVTEVINPTTVYMCVLDEATKSKRATVDNLLKAYADKGVAYVPKKDEVVLTKFSQDGEWYRARITGYVSDTDKKSSQAKSFHVRFIDFGNGEVRTAQDIRVCDNETLRNVPPLAFEAQIAYLKPLPKTFSNLVTDAVCAYLEGATSGLFARKEYECGVQKFYTLTTKPENISEGLSHHLVRSGMGIVHAAVESLDHAEIKRSCAELVTLQGTAQKAGKNVWQYGTAVTEDDDEDGPL